MANQTDATLIFDTEIDSKGFTKDSDELKKAVKSLSNKIERLGPTFQKALAGNAGAIKKFNATSSTLEKTIENIEERMEEMANEKYPTAEYTHATKEIEKTEQALEKLKGKREQLKALGKDKTLSDEYKATKKEVASVEKELSKLRAKQDALLDGSLKEYVDKIKAAAQERDATIEKNNQIINTPGVSEEFKNSARQSNESARTMFEAQKQSLANEYSKDIAAEKALEAAISQANEKLEEHKAKLSELKASGSMNTETAEWQKLQYQIDTAENELENYKTKKSELETSGKGFVSGADTQTYHQLAEELDNAKTNLKDMNSQIPRGNRFASSMKSTFSKIGTTVKGTLKKGIHAFASGIKNAHKSADGLHKKILKMGIALLGMHGIMGGIKQIVQSALSNNEQLQQQLTAAKGVLGQAFTPIINALISGLSKVVTLADRIYSIFSGVSLIAKYNATQTSKMASGTSSAAKSAKGLKRQLAGFDELNVLSDSSSDSSEDGSPGSDVATFEPSALSAKVSDFINQLKKLYAAGDYAGIGSLIGTAINGGLQTINDYISWDNVGAKITKGVTAFTTALNSLVDTINWELLGDTFAQGINTLANTLFLLLTQIDFGRMGQALAENFNGLIHGIDWGLLGQTLGAAVQDVIMFCYKAVTTFDWKGLGSAFATFVNDAFDNVDWKLLGTTLSESIKGALGTLRTAIQEIDWKAIGQDVSDFLNGIDWVGIISDLAGLVSDVLVGAGDLLCGFVEELDWGKLASDLWNSLVGLITNIDWSKLIANAFELLGALLSASAQIWVSFTTTIADGISNALTNVITKIQSDIEACGGNVIEGLKKGISDAFSNIWQWIKDNIFYPFIDGFCSAFGIHSPSREMATLGEYIIEGLKNGIIGVWDTVTDFFGTALEDLKVSITNGFNNAKDNAVSAVENLKTKVSDTFNTTKTNVSNTVNKLKTDATTAFNSAKTNIANTATNIKNNVVNAFSNAKTNAVNSFNTLKSNTSSSINSLKNDVSSRMDDIKNSITSNLQNALDNAKNRDWESIGINICTGISDGINEKWQWLKDKVGDVASSLLDKAKRVLDIHSPSRSFRDIIGKNIMLGLGGGLENGTSNVLKTVSDIAKSISNEFANQTYKTGTIVPTAEVNGALSAFSDEVTDSFTTMLDKLQAIADTVTFKAPNIATSGVIPYSVSASIAADTSNIGDKIEASNDELASVFIQSITNQTAALVAALQSNKSQNAGTIDYSKITSNVIDDINRRTRMLGASPLTI